MKCSGYYPPANLYLAPPKRIVSDPYGSRLGHLIAVYRQKCLEKKTKSLTKFVALLADTLDRNGLLETLVLV